MITRIEIAGYKSIKSLELNLQPINILLGGNGAGKSNFVSLFSLIRNIYNKNLQNYIQKKGGADSLLHFGKQHTSSIDIAIYFRSSSDHENKFMIRLETLQDRLLIRSTKTAFKWQGKWKEREYETNILESEFQDINTNQAFWVNDRLKGFDVYHFHDTSDTSPMKAMGDLHDNARLKRDGSNLAAFLYYLKEKEPKHFKRIELTIKSIAPFFDHFVLEPNRLNEQKIQLEWRENGFPETYFNAYHLSDGTLRFICLATLLMQPNPPATIIIDEPELGLHPVAVNKLAALVRKASKKAQIILSTQSINLIDNFEPEDIIVANRENHASVFKRLSSKDLQIWLEDYTLGDLWGQNKLGAQPYSV
ncbi:AAA family ATPase [Tunicatimonas pelagia]|uniref:AAA family ATPase n=1 Tax=Tunicatimonas pelagia TaxID=931531 RepID=UPI0026663903|nr:AAA family ATPase [Tunicatimonas pelagia]WKN40624.1 AAA family ATPase [Tunicatimonas pelagia]